MPGTYHTTETTPGTYYATTPGAMYCWQPPHLWDGRANLRTVIYLYAQWRTAHVLPTTAPSVGWTGKPTAMPARPSVRGWRNSAPVSVPALSQVRAYSRLLEDLNSRFLSSISEKSQLPFVRLIYVLTFLFLLKLVCHVNGTVQQYFRPPG